MNQKATAFALIPTLEINQKIKGVNFKSGNRFSLEYGISQYLTERLEIEIINAHNWQISKDKGDDFWWSGTRFDGKDYKSTISVGSSYWVLKNILSLRFKYIQDYTVKQRFKNRFFSLSLLLMSPKKNN